MAESNRKCSRLGEWFVQEEIARAIDTALETIIGLSKRKQFKYHGGESLFALDFHTERRTSSLLPLVFFPPSSYLRGELTRGLHHYHPKVCCHVRAAWLASGLCVWRHTKWNSLCVSLYCMCVCVCVCGGVRVYCTSWEYEVVKRDVHKQKEFASKQKVYSLQLLFSEAQKLSVLLFFLYFPPSHSSTFRLEADQRTGGITYWSLQDHTEPYWWSIAPLIYPPQFVEPLDPH